MSVNLTTALQNVGGRDPNYVDSGPIGGPPGASRQTGILLLDSDTVSFSAGPVGIYDTITAAAVATALPTGSGNKVIATPANGTSGVSALRALVSADLPVGSASQIGGVEVDGTTITASAGVISAVPSGAMVLIQSIAGGVGSSTITFSSIPQTYKHLKVIIGGAGNSGGTPVLLTVTFNGDSGFSYVQAYTLNTAGTVTGVSAGAFGIVFGALGAQGDTGSSELTIPNYTSTTHKACHGSGMGGDSVSTYQLTSGGTYGGSNLPITSLTISVPGNFQSGGLCSLYGING